MQLIEVTFVPGSADEFGLVIRGNGNEAIDTAPLRAVDGAYNLRIFVDHCSVEIFAEDGEVTLAELIFPDPSSTGVSLYTTG